MAPLQHLSLRKVLLLYLVLFVFSTIINCACSETQRKQFLGKRLLDAEKEQDQPKKKTNTLSTTKNQTKLIKPNTNSTKSSPSLVTKTQMSKKLNSTSKPSNSTKTTPTIKTQLIKKLNSTSKASNSTKASSILGKKLSSELTTPKNKTTKPVVVTKQSQIQSDEKKPKSGQTVFKEKKTNTQQKKQKSNEPSWLEGEDEDDLVSEFRDLPSKFQQTLLPDLEQISTTSKAYYNKANKEITDGFKPIVGKKYAPTVASIISFAFILIPLLLVSLVFNRIKAYFSLQKILIFIQIYLSIYFSILCLSSLVTGLEPLRFFYATSLSTYVCVQVLQTLAYVLYLLLLLMYLVLVFSTDCGLGSKMLGLVQTFVGCAVGLHYYVSVFHRVVLHQPPKTNWKIHGIYATCFLVVCLLANAERRKKAYLEEGGEEGKKN